MGKHAVEQIKVIGRSNPQGIAAQRFVDLGPVANRCESLRIVANRCESLRIFAFLCVPTRPGNRARPGLPRGGRQAGKSLRTCPPCGPLLDCWIAELFASRPAGYCSIVRLVHSGRPPPAGLLRSRRSRLSWDLLDCRIVCFPPCGLLLDCAIGGFRPAGCFVRVVRGSLGICPIVGLPNCLPPALRAIVRLWYCGIPARQARRQRRQ